MATTYVPLAVDRAFAAGLLEWDLLDARFPEALQEARRQGIQLAYEVAPFPEADHPNAFDIQMEASAGNRLRLLAKSTGGGAIEITSVAGFATEISGGHFETIVEIEERVSEEMARRFEARVLQRGDGARGTRALYLQRSAALGSEDRQWLAGHTAVKSVRSAEPLLFVQRGEPLFSSADEMIRLATDAGCSLGRVGLRYESRLLGLAEDEVLDEMTRRYRVMEESVARGLAGDAVGMQFLDASAGSLLEAEGRRRVALGGPHTRAAARALAVMHVSNSLGIVCAAPTAGSAGVLPGVLVTLAEEKGLSEEQVALALLAASAVGLIIARRGTFAAEIAGCQVEIGAAGAMAAAAVVEIAFGDARRATDAAAIALQNTMGSVCDPVQGTCEIPCHTRNGVAASSAFVCADLVLGGYRNPISLDETIDASMAVGRRLPSELRCTALGGIAATPSAKRLRSRW
jgi:L-serine dehydratase